MVSDTMKLATIEVFNLPYGFQLHKHYWYSQYGEIDYEDIRFSVVNVTDETSKHVSVVNCLNYEHAMVMFLAQMQATRDYKFNDLVPWICKLLDIEV